MKTKAAVTADAYLELIKRFPLRPIRSKKQLDEAYAIIDELAISGEAHLSGEQMDYLEVLGNLTTAYEAKRSGDRTAQLTGLEILKHLLDANDLNGSDLGRILGQRALGSKVLNGDREISKANAKALGEHFGLPAETFLR